MYRKSVKISLILVYLVIIAGAVVRMTGSGMGCPDWPKCFGYYIPPTEVSEIEFQPNREYKKGQVIIVDESLKVAASNFTSSDSYNTANWENYEKHDYAIFNPTHTWVEYINRLSGALAGFAVLIMALLSLKKFRHQKKNPDPVLVMCIPNGLSSLVGSNGSIFCSSTSKDHDSHGDGFGDRCGPDLSLKDIFRKRNESI